MSDAPRTSDTDIGPEHLLVLYDGVCPLCNGTVSFLMKRDPGDLFRFAPLQTRFARDIVVRAGFDPDDLRTVFVVDAFGREDETIRKRSRAVLRAITALGGGWKLFHVLRIVPTFLLDIGYRFVARIRYKLFGGKKESCPLPPADARHKFVMPE